MEEVIPILYAASKEAMGPLTDIYNYIIAQTDPRTRNWPLINSPFPLTFIITVYLYLCIFAGPKFMKKRKAFELKYVLMIYNLFQVIFSAYLVWEYLQSGWATNYSYICEPVDYSNDPQAVRMAATVWWYFIAKLIDILDTVFYILRKKNYQISFLHLYHHSAMPTGSWLAVKFVPGGHGTLLGLINSIIHIIMYSYHLLASFGPKFQRYLWSKRHLTEMLMVQFSILILHNLQVIFIRCDYPKIVSVILIVHAFLFLAISIWTFERNE